MARLEGALQDSEARYRQALSENERLQAQFLQAQKMEAVGRLASGLAHDFKNVLTLIGGYTDLLLKRTTDPAVREELAEIRAACQRAIGLSQQLLAVGRKDTAHQKEVSLNTILDDAGKMLRRMLAANIELVVLEDPALGLVSADPGQLHQVLLNLVVNARDAMPDGGRLVVETRNVEVEAGSAAAGSGAPPGACVRLSVSDTGVGMDEATRRSAMEPFFTTKQGNTGTGLGLSTVNAIVRQSSGAVVLESESGRGTSVLVYLPRVAVGTQAAAPQQAAAGEARAPRRARVLVLDEDEGIRGLLADILGAAGVDVLPGRSWPAGDPSSGGPPPSAALVDEALIERDDGAALEVLRRRWPGMTVIAMSSSYGGAPVTLTRRLGILATVAKPIAPRQVLRALRDVIDAD